MKSIFVVHQYENYMYRDNYIPYKRAFLGKEEVIEFLLKQNNNDNNHNLSHRDKMIEEINKNLSYSESVSYGDYHYETEEIPIGEFNY